MTAKANRRPCENKGGDFHNSRKSLRKFVHMLEHELLCGTIVQDGIIVFTILAHARFRHNAVLRTRFGRHKEDLSKSVFLFLKEIL
jgi:hypothetical protein